MLMPKEQTERLRFADGVTVVVAKERKADFGVTIDGELVHCANGRTVKAGDMKAGQSYNVDMSGLTWKTHCPDCGATWRHFHSYPSNLQTDGITGWWWTPFNELIERET
jgi:hypothetical protein